MKRENNSEKLGGNCVTVGIKTEDTILKNLGGRLYVKEIK